MHEPRDTAVFVRLLPGGLLGLEGSPPGRRRHGRMALTWLTPAATWGSGVSRMLDAEAWEGMGFLTPRTLELLCLNSDSSSATSQLCDLEAHVIETGCVSVFSAENADAGGNCHVGLLRGFSG